MRGGRVFLKNLAMIVGLFFTVACQSFAGAFRLSFSVCLGSYPPMATSKSARLPQWLPVYFLDFRKMARELTCTAHAVSISFRILKSSFPIFSFNTHYFPIILSPKKDYRLIVAKIKDKMHQMEGKSITRYFLNITVNNNKMVSKQRFTSYNNIMWDVINNTVYNTVRVYYYCKCVQHIC